MAMNQGELRAEVVGNHGGITGKDTVIDTLLNLIQMDLSWIHNWRDLQTLDSSKSLAVAAYQITLPTTIQRIEFCKLLDASDNWHDVDILPLSDFRNLEDGSGTPVPSDTGVPEYAHLLGSVLTFNKKASEALTAYLDAFIYPTDMADDDDYPSITKVDPVFIAYATAWLYQHRKQPQTANVWFGMADQFFKTISNSDHGVEFQFTRKQMGI